MIPESLQRLIPKRLDIQVILISGLLLAITIPAYEIYEANRESEQLEASVRLQTQVLAENISITSIGRIVTQDFSSLDSLLLRSARFPNIIDIKVSDNTGRVLSEVVSVPGSSPQPRYSPDAISVPVEGSEYQRIENDHLIVWHPVKSGSLLGWVRINYDLHNLIMEKKDSLSRNMRDGIALIIILVLLLLLVLRGPLKTIRNATDFATHLGEMAGQKMDVSYRSIELKQLTIALNRTSENIHEQNVTISKALKDLETQKYALDQHSVVSTTDKNGIILYANDKFCSLSEYNREELLGNKHNIVNSGYHDRAFFKSMWTTISSGKVWHNEIMNRSKSGHEFWANTTIVPFMDNEGNPYQYVAIRTDITEIKHIEHELEVKNATLKVMTNNLEIEVGKRTQELESANEKLTYLNNVKSEFISVVSHELRTPLTSIKSFAEILIEDIDDIDTEMRHRYLSIINDESDRLGRLINDVLDLQKIDSGKMSWHMEKSNLVDIIKSSVEVFSKAFAAKGLTVKENIIDDNISTMMDIDKIKQVMSNLLSNALKFTDNGGITVSAYRVVAYTKAVIVEDDESSRNYLAALLENYGLDVECFENGKQACDYILKSGAIVNIVFTDIDMPEMDGMDLLKEIRKVNVNLPVVMTTVKNDSDIFSEIVKHDANYYIEKPIVSDKVKMIVEKSIGKVSGSRHLSEIVQIAVTDTGMGMPEEDADKVFGRFYQVDSTQTRRQGGSGLGLSITKEIIGHHHGNIWVESNPGMGSTFLFTLPVASN